ncbi:hypothetical protein PybrP1_008974 [[Pythium] brassicae (nom. inval.)]|nr:hypothetical protein PybrP1_008974 [[Pythium] brassicae (nom. inval.)]
MKSLLQIVVVVLAVTLAVLTWYVTLAPFWITQSGRRADASAAYAQGIGLWLNYTEHVGDPTYDPGNSLWIPAQESAAHSFADQCAADAPFCDNAIGELHKQFCQVRRVYCGPAVKFLQVALALLSGFALLVAVWAVLVVTTARRTVVDHYLMQLCIGCGLSFLVVAAVWYVFVFRAIIESAYYKDQYNRCATNAAGRKCWGMGTCLYLIITCAVLYPMLSVFVANHVTRKFRAYQRALRKLHESATVLSMAPPSVDLKLSMLSTVDLNKSELNVATTGVSVDLSGDESAQPPLAPLKKLPSVVRAVNVHEIDVSDSETEERRDDMFESKYQHKVYEASTATDTKKKATKKSSKKKGDATTTSTSASTTTSTSAGDAKLSKTVAVISDELIRKVACADVDAANTNAVNEGEQSVDFVRLQTLALSFQNIFKMENLETLRHLVKLQLDNNVIHEIDGIAHLVHLEWLDLSFNNIAAIKGLDTLVRLTDLSLYNNCIAKLENLDALRSLQVLSVGNNSLATTDGLLYLKCLDSLRVLNLAGNPVCSDPEYRTFLLAHLDRLQYLDYALVDSNEAVQAREQYQDELEEMKEVKAIEDAALAREAEQLKYFAVLKDANVIILETLLSDMFKEDTEMNKIEVLPGLRNLIDDYSEKARVVTEDVKVVLLGKHSAMAKEVDAFAAKYEKVQLEAQESSIAAVESHRRVSKQLLKQASAAQAGDSNETSAAGQQLLGEAKASAEKLHCELMILESDLVETAQELTASMEVAIEAIGVEAREIVTEHFRTVEVLENGFFDNVSQLAVTLLERMASEDGDDDDFLTDECRVILNDRDALNNAINGSHDIHIGKLLAQEDVMREQSLAKIAAVIKRAKDREWTRNRSRIAEIITIKEKHLGEISKVRDELSRVDDEFY